MNRTPATSENGADNRENPARRFRRNDLGGGQMDGVWGERCRAVRLLAPNAHMHKAKKLTAPEGLPRQSPTLVLTGPCAA